MENGSNQNHYKNAIYYLNLENCKISSRSRNALKNQNIIYLGDLVQKSERELLHIKNFGRKMLNEIKEFLVEAGLCLETKLIDFDPDNKSKSVENKMHIAKKLQKECNSIAHKINSFQKQLFKRQEGLDVLLEEINCDLHHDHYAINPHVPWYKKIDLKNYDNLEIY